MANEDTQQGVPQSELMQIPTPPKEQASGSEEDDMGIVFQKTQSAEHKKLDMDAPLTAPQGRAPQPKRRSLLTNTDDVFDVGGAFHGGGLEAGTIVTDKRRKHLGFGAALIGAFNEWSSETSAKIQHIELPKRKEPVTVDAPENRKEIIVQAALNTKQVPRDDHAIVIEKFKTLSHDAERITGKPYLIKKEGEATAPIHAVPKKSDSSSVLPPPPVMKTSTVPTVSVREKQTLDLRTVSVAPKVEQHVQKNIADFPSVQKDDKPHTIPAPVVTKIERPHTQPVTRGVVRGDVAPRVNEHTKITLPPIPPAEAPKKEVKPVSSGSGWSHFTQNEASETQKEAVSHLPPDNLPVAESFVPPAVPVTPRVLETAEKVVQKPIEPIIEKKELPTPTPIVHVAQAEKTLGSGMSFPHIDAVDLRAPEQSAVPPLHTTKKSSTYVLIVVLVVIVGIVAGVGTAVYVSKNMNDSTPTTATPVMSSFFNVDSITPVSFTTARPVLMSTLDGAMKNAPGGIVQISFTKEGASGKQLGIPETAEVFGVLAPHMGSRFLRALDSTFMIGSVTTEVKAPFIVLRSNSFDTAFAGMLEWEPFMQADLAPLFGTPETGNEKNKTRTQFTDALSSNKSIRILYDTEKNERIIYAFVNNNTIVITSSTEALSAIIARMQ